MFFCAVKDSLQDLKQKTYTEYLQHPNISSLIYFNAADVIINFFFCENSQKKVCYDWILCDKAVGC